MRTGLFEQTLNVIAGVVLFAMMMLTSVDVVARYVFDAPLGAAFELTELMMAVLICAGLPLVSLHEEHVTLDLLERWMSPKVRRMLSILADVLCGVALAGVGWLLFVKGQQLDKTGDTTAAMHIKLAPFTYLMAALVLCTGLIHVWLLFRRPRRKSGGIDGAI